jgi:hypothetical protein
MKNEGFRKTERKKGKKNTPRSPVKNPHALFRRTSARPALLFSKIAATIAATSSKSRKQERQRRAGRAGESRESRKPLDAAHRIL